MKPSERAQEIVRELAEKDPLMREMLNRKPEMLNHIALMRFLDEHSHVFDAPKPAGSDDPVDLCFLEALAQEMDNDGRTGVARTLRKLNVALGRLSQPPAPWAELLKCGEAIVRRPEDGALIVWSTGERLSTVLQFLVAPDSSIKQLGGLGEVEPALLQLARYLGGKG